MAQEKPGEFWGKVHYREYGYSSWTLCNRNAQGSLKTTNIKKKVTCKTCKGLIKYRERIKRTGRHG